jgi:Na+:H+ antiporter, NhaA family
MLREFSAPLLSGVIVALVWGNYAPDCYRHFDHDRIFGPFSFHLLVNDFFMVLFLGIAAAEITQS